MLFAGVLTLKQRVLPVVLLRYGLDGVHCSLLDGQQWRDIDVDSVVALHFKPYLIWVVDSERSIFKMLTFPLDLVSKAGLGEAVHLALQEFSPWGDHTACYFRSTTENDQWAVKVWAWHDDTEQQLIKSVIDVDISLTHMIPEYIVYASTMVAGEQLLFVEKENAAVEAVLIDTDLLPKLVQNVDSEDAYIRFRHAVQRYAGDRPSAVLVYAHDAVEWLADVDGQRYKPVAMRYDMFGSGRLAGTLSWWSVAVWKKPMLAILSLLMLWMVGEYALIQYENNLIKGRYEQAIKSADHVLAFRDRVASNQSKLVYYSRAKKSQESLFLVLEWLSRSLPQGVRFRSAQYREGVLTVYGLGDDVGGLPSLLEKSKLIDKAEFLGAIQVDPISEKEKFSLRIILAEV